MLREEEAGREKVFVHPNFLRLLKSEEPSFAPCRQE